MRLERIMSKRVERKLWGYPEEWVVFTYSRILAHAPSINDELKKAAARKGAILHYVPNPNVIHFYLVAS